MFNQSRISFAYHVYKRQGQRGNSHYFWNPDVYKRQGQRGNSHYFWNPEICLFLEIPGNAPMEQSINDLRAEMGVESSPSLGPTAKPTEEETKEGGSA
ncbi:hypothetical protein DEO72_LG6g1517 [Vigna unguiculata]|uniref:Uncharacterized protein n=1 Tax=Vigna unguiculata TaxID=3917 RepID=A0A4D6M7C0_VIGUN|nr:hypothetical protein DEO72_LG6g1517 [Vigna unguiculata]